MQHIKNLLNKRLKEAGLAKDVKTALVIKEFEELVKEFLGNDISQKVKPIYIKNKNLVVVCLSSVIVQEFTFYKQEMIYKINNKFEEEVLKDIKFNI
jgi:predicted nucleic acid-binding Zn ribbon protein